MIKGALIFIKQQLDQHLALDFDLDESAVVLNSLLEEEGEPAKKNQNKMVITMINLDHETSRQYSGMQRRVDDNQVAVVNQAVLFNIDLLFTANFDDYEEALKFLSATISFFQANASFNASNRPGMPIGVSKLNFEIENSSYLDTHNLWSAMGASYRPSIIYKIRHVTIDAEEINALQPTVSGIATQVSA